MMLYNIILYYAIHVAQLLAVFKVISYSEKGSNSRQKEEDAYAKFVDYLDECERGKPSIKDSIYYRVEAFMSCASFCRDFYG